MIVAVCADKASPGVTTAAVALALVWPGPRLVMEADPAGGDLAFRARNPQSGRLIRSGRGLLALAADARIGVPADALPRYAQPTAWGVDVICGPPSAASYAPMRSLWPAVADAAAAWSGTAIADLGRLYPGSPATALAQRADGGPGPDRGQRGGLVPPAGPVAGVGVPARRPDARGEPGRRRAAGPAPGRRGRRPAGHPGAGVGRLPGPGAGIAGPRPGVGADAAGGPAHAPDRRGHLPRSAADVAARVLQRWPHLATPTGFSEAVGS